MRKLFLLAFLVLSCNVASAESLGNGYDCTGSALTLKSKTIALSKAKPKINTSIDSVKAQLSSTPKGSKKATSLKNKLANLKTLLSNVKQCPVGKYVPAIFKTIAKSYSTGTWNNTTFNTSGAISANISLSKTTLSVSVNIGGSMFGSLTPGPVEFNTDLGGATFPLTLTASNTTIGALEIVFQSNGDFTVEETVVPSLPNIMRATLDFKFSNGAYSGTFESFLVGNTQLAQGNANLS